jgi:hypothetical protein
MGVEQRELLVTVPRIASSSMSSVMVAGACGKLRQKVSTNAAVIRAVSMRDGVRWA